MMLRITRLAHRKSYLVINSPNSHEQLTKREIRSSWSWFEHCSESLCLVPRKSYLVIICPNSHEKLTKSEIMSSWESVRTLLGITRLVYRKSYLVIIGPNSQGKYCVHPRMVYRLAIVMPPPPHFGWPKMNFDRTSRHFRAILDFFLQNGCRRPFWMTNRISRHFRSILNFLFCSQNGCRRPFWMTENHFRSHFSSFQINTQLFFLTKWLPAVILDDWKSLSIAFLAISDQYTTFIFFPQNGCRRPFWMTENHFRMHFSPFQINMQFLFFIFFIKMAAAGYFGSPKITFDRISRHFRSIRNFDFFPQNGCQRPFWMTENHFWSHFSPFHQYATFFFPQNGCRRPFWMTTNHFLITFLAISEQYATFIFIYFFTKWLPTAILDDWKSLSNAFLAISDQYATFFLWIFFKMATGRHFGSPFWAILDDRKSLSIAFLAISLFFLFFFSKWPPAAILEVWFAPQTIGFFHYVLSMAMPNIKLIGEFVTQLEMPQTFWAFLYKMAARGHFVFPIDDKNHRVLVIWDLNGYGEYKFDRCICDKVMACTRVGMRRRRRRCNQKHNITKKFKFWGYNYGHVIYNL